MLGQPRLESQRQRVVHQRALIEQRYSDADDREHAEFLADAFSRPNYLRLDGRPVFAIYRTQTLPDAGRTLSVLAEACSARACPRPYVVRFETNGSELDPAEHGCDAAAELYPHWLYHHPELQPPALALGHELDWLVRLRRHRPHGAGSPGPTVAALPERRPRLGHHGAAS